MIDACNFILLYWSPTWFTSRFQKKALWCELEVFLKSHHNFKAYNCIMMHLTKKEHPFDIAYTNEIAERSLPTMGSYINSVKSENNNKL
ncbi:hypothetical protein A3Q56_07423 [Intoshia linei]|uniref:Uncharacterized protein n=1 Tax=Intoshia linei TaxID=1819745 RepID=A0A177ATU6_9BILA|nr:hypothetical protein A3Q56_07423 [Intoshia linei]